MTSGSATAAGEGTAGSRLELEDAHGRRPREESKFKALSDAEMSGKSWPYEKAASQHARRVEGGRRLDTPMTEVTVSAGKR